ncbi:MAG: sensor histidine kinase [Iamia sp.]
MAVLFGVLAAGLVVAVAVLALRVRALTERAGDRAALERSQAQAWERAQEAELSRQHMQEALNTVPQVVVVVDVEGRVVARNHPDRGLVARHGEALVESAVDELLADALGGRSRERTLDLFGPPRRVVLVTSEPLPHGALVVTADVTEARRIESMRRDFVANLSHELKTPVGAIGLLAETLLTEPDPDVAQRLAERVVNESFRVSRTIDDLLELSRIEAGAEAAREVVPVHLVLEEAADRLRPAAEQRDIAIDVEEVSPRVSAVGDRRQLVSAVANLLDNAIKYSDPASRVVVRARADGDAVAIDVEDHGLGIPARDVERVFERFYRVDRARSRETGGTGLGLAIVRHVAANHDGDISVRSVEGEGSTFTISVPAGPGPHPVTHEADIRPQPRRTA